MYEWWGPHQFSYHKIMKVRSEQTLIIMGPGALGYSDLSINFGGTNEWHFQIRWGQADDPE